jgi:hypothetical protein
VNIHLSAVEIGARMYVLAVIEHGSGRIRVPGATPHPTAFWVVQAAKNLVMDFEDTGCRARFLIRDRDGKFPALFDAVLADAGKVVRKGQARWTQSGRPAHGWWSRSTGR